MQVLDHAAMRAYPLGVRLAALLRESGKAAAPDPLHSADAQYGAPSVALAQAVCKRLKLPNDCRDLALMTAREQGHVGRAWELSPAAIVALLMRCDALRKPQRFQQMLLALEYDDCAGCSGTAAAGCTRQEYLMGALQAAQAVAAGAIAAHCQAQPQQIAAAILAARIAAVQGYMAARNSDLSTSA